MTWRNKPSNFTKEVEDDVDGAIRSAAFKILRTVVVRSPVDTGHFKGNWLVAIGFKPRRDTTERVDKGGSSTVSGGLSVISRQSGFASIWISNNLPYGERLNAGHSTQAPAGFVEAAVRRASR